MTTPKLSITNIKKYLKENELDAVDFYCDWSITSLRNNRQDIVDHFGISSIEVDDVQTSDESRLTVRYGMMCKELNKRISVSIDNDFKPHIDYPSGILVELKRFQESSQHIQKFLSSKLS